MGFRLSSGVFIVWDLLFGFQFFGNPFGRQCFLAEGSLFSSLPFFLLVFGYIYLIVALVPFVSGFSMHLLPSFTGFKCMLMFLDATAKLRWVDIG